MIWWRIILRMDIQGLAKLEQKPWKLESSVLVSVVMLFGTFSIPCVVDKFAYHQSQKIQRS